MRLFYRLCQLVQEQKGVLEPPELPAGYATGSNVTFDQLLHVNLVRGISGIACFLISVTLLLSLLFIFRAYKNTLQRLILYYAIATTIYQAFNISFLEHQFQYEGQDTVCAVLGGCVYYIVGVTVILAAFHIKTFCQICPYN